jgi:polyisoprenoid-binding protein YceI
MKIKPAILSALLALLAAGASAQTRTYTIVPSESSFWVFVAKAGLFSAFAHDHEIGVKRFSGRVTIPSTGASGAGAGSVTNGSLQLEIEAKSLAVLDKKPSEADKKKIFDAMHNDVLESGKYETIEFKSAAVSDWKQTGEDAYNFTLAGDLRLHGVTKRIAVPVRLTVTPQQLRATGQCTLRQSDFGIKPYSAAGGTVKVKNEVVVHFDIVAKP